MTLKVGIKMKAKETLMQVELRLHHDKVVGMVVQGRARLSL